MKNDPTGDTLLPPLFKFQRVREWTTQILCLDPSKVPPQSPPASHSPRMNLGLPAQRFF